MAFAIASSNGFPRESLEEVIQMGSYTCIVISNDKMDIIDRDPVAWWRDVGRRMYETHDKNRGWHPAGVSKVVWMEHGSQAALIRVGGFEAEVVARVTESSNHDGKGILNTELNLLKELAAKHGFSLHKKPVALVHQPPTGNPVVINRFNTVREAERYIAYEINKEDPNGVNQGHYGVDAPEYLLNKKKSTKKNKKNEKSKI